MRYKTGETCNAAGNYRFDGYLDGTETPAPAPEERVIPMKTGFPFPAVRSAGKAAWWRKI